MLNAPSSPKAEPLKQPQPFLLNRRQRDPDSALWILHDNTRFSEEIPESQAKINEELFRFKADLTSEMARVRMKLDVLVAMAVKNRASNVFDAMSHPESEYSDELPAAEDVDDVQSNELVVQIEAESGKIVSPIATCSLLDELPKPKYTTIYYLIEDDRKLTHPVFPIVGSMVEQSGACKVFAEMTEPILEKYLLGIKVTKAAHNLLDERPMLSPVDSELIFVGHFEEHNGNNDSTPLIVCVPRVFDPGRVTTENIFPKGSSIVEIGSSIVEIECTFTPPFVPSSISLKHIGATVLLNMPLPSLQLVSFISWSGNESIYESCMKHLLDQKEEIGGYTLVLVLHGCEVGPELFGKARKNCDNGLKVVDREIFVLKNASDRVLEEMHHPNSISIQGGDGVTNEENYSVVDVTNEGFSRMLDTKQLQASEKVT